MSTNLRSHFLRFTLFLPGIFVLACGTLWAQASDSQGSGANKSWTTTTESQNADANPTRTTETHKQNGNRTTDTQSIQRKGFDGHYEPYLDIETETVQVDTGTTKTITRTYSRDSSGAKKLTQVTEEEKHSRPSGDSNVVRTTSNADLDGKLQVIQRETEETKKTGENTEETQKTVMLPGVDGMAPAMKTQERRVKGANDTVDSQTTTLLPDGSGNWKAGEIRKATKKGTKNPTVDVRVSRPDGEGNMSEISHTVTRETETPSGEKKNTVETYSADVAGQPRDGGLHLVERTTTVQHTDLRGQQITQQQVEQPNPGDPGAGLRVTIVSTDTVRPGASEVQGTHTIQTRDANGNFGTVSVDLSKSNNLHTVQVPAAPAEKKPAEKAAPDKPPADKK
jgi:hypothetical protein